MKVNFKFFIFFLLKLKFLIYTILMNALMYGQMDGQTDRLYLRKGETLGIFLYHNFHPKLHIFGMHKNFQKIVENILYLIIVFSEFIGEFCIF